MEVHRELVDLMREGCSSAEVCLELHCSHRATLQFTLRDAIGVLESTRSSFKSKRLEVLRKRLMGVLAEIE
jgi:hypothetical protein